MIYWLFQYAEWSVYTSEMCWPTFMWNTDFGCTSWSERTGGTGGRTIDRLSYHWFSKPLFSWHVWEHLKRAFCMKRKHDPSHSPLTDDHSGVLGLGWIIQLYGSCIQEIFCNAFWLPVYGFDQSDMFWLVSCNCHLSVTISTQHSLSTSMSIRFWQDHWKTIL